MAARKGAVEGLKTMVSSANEYAHGLTLIGGALLVAGGLGAYVVDLRHQVKVAEMKAQEHLKVVEVKAQEQLKVVEVKAQEQLKVVEVKAQEQLKVVETKAQEQLKLVAMTAQKDVEAARRETAEKFLTYGFAEEYSNYQKLLKLRQAQEPTGEK